MGVVESTLREVEKVTIRPLGEVARTVEEVTVRPLGQLAREVEKVTIRPLGQAARNVEKEAIRPTKDLVERTASMIGRTLDIYKPDRSIPANAGMQGMESTIKEMAKSNDISQVKEDNKRLQGDIRERILQTPSNAGETLAFLSMLEGMTMVIENLSGSNDELMRQNEELNRACERLTYEENELNETIKQLG